MCVIFNDKQTGSGHRAHYSMSLEDRFDEKMDLLWGSMPFGMRGNDLRDSPMSRSPLSAGGLPKSRRSLTSFPRLTGRDRSMNNYRPMTFRDDVFPSRMSNNDDISHRINIHHDNGRPSMSSNDDSK